MMTLPALITRQRDPDNFESPFSELDCALTPNAAFYRRTHFDSPALDPAAWRLRVEGVVNTAVELSLSDLRAMPSRTHTAVLECAGNGRLFLKPKKEGVQWESGAVGCARWTGVPLAEVLNQVGVQSSAVDVVLEGADVGTPEKADRPKNKIAYSRSLPLKKALEPSVLLAYEMNDEPLTRTHGAPVRTVVPGWYAMSSVKWLRRIAVVDHAFQGFFQTVEYAYWSARDGQIAERVPVGEIRVKSVIARPAMQERIALGSPIRVFGSAWSSGAVIAKVEVSVDDGNVWNSALLVDPGFEHAWQRWEYWWTPHVSGQYTLRSRATDAAGNVQPSEHNKDHGSYIIHHTLPVLVELT